MSAVEHPLPAAIHLLRRALSYVPDGQSLAYDITAYLERNDETWADSYVTGRQGLLEQDKWRA